MRAIFQDTYGSVDGLELRDIEQPVIGADEVLVRVHAAGLDQGVWHILTGLPYPVRLAGYGLRAPKTPVPGVDLAGDEVFGLGKGAYAEYARAPQDKLALKPADLTFEQAAVVGISGSTALQAVRDHAKVRAGQQVLIVGAPGGVGSYAVQLAKVFGAEVTGVCSTAKVDMVGSLGADHVIDYNRDDFARGERRYDVVLETGGNSSLSRLRRALTAKGTLVIVGGEAEGRWLGGSDRQLRAVLLSLFVRQKLGTFITRENREDLIVLKELIEAGSSRRRSTAPTR